jgi:hypothetical protein
MSDQRQFVLEKWNEYRRSVIPIAAHPSQVTAMRNAFYAGALGVLAVAVENMEADTASLSKGIAEELAKYVSDLNVVNQ